MKKSIYTCAFLLTLISLCSCGGDISSLFESSSSSYSSEETSTENYSKKTINILDRINYFNIEGRFDYLDDGITCDWSGSAMEFKADIEGEVSINITSKYNNYDDSKNGKRGLTLFSTYVDGERTNKNLEVDNITKDLLICSGLEKGTHLIKLVRQTNVYMSQASLNSITIQGNLIKNQARKTLIEFLGDSYTTGYSLQGVAENGGYDSRYDDPLDAYAYQASLNLDSDYMLTAFSGAGFAYGYTDFTVSQAYKYQNYFTGTKNYQPDRVPDLLAINLGTNDVAQVGFNNCHTQIKNGVKKLIDETYEVYQTYLPLVFCTDSSHENNDSVIKQAMDELLPDVKYSFVSLTTNDAKYNYHPSAECGHKQGKELAEAIKEYLPEIF